MKNKLAELLRRHPRRVVALLIGVGALIGVAVNPELALVLVMVAPDVLELFQ